jgi:hypothetical protein
MSYISMCGGPPGSQMKMTDVSVGDGADVSPCARNRSKSLKANPPRPKVPTLRNDRREIGPEQRFGSEGMGGVPMQAEVWRETSFILSNLDA